jgi:hypothetical protein
MLKESNDYMNFNKQELRDIFNTMSRPILNGLEQESNFNINALQNKKAKDVYSKYSNQMFGELTRPKQTWKDIIYRKMIQFSTGLGFNFSNQMINNWELMYTMGYLGGISWGYWTTIALLQYYLDPRWIAYPTTPGFGRFDDYDEGILHRRIDGDAASLASTAATGLMGVLMPDGLRSFKMSFDKTRRVLRHDKSEIQLEQLSYLEIIANELLRERLTSSDAKYYSKLNSMMCDYLDYGTCSALLEPCASADHFDLTYIPFAESGLASTNYDVIQIGSWIQPLPLVNAYANHMSDTGGTMQGFINHLYVPGDQIEGCNANRYYELTQFTKNVAAMDLAPHSIREIGMHDNHSPLLVARTNDKGQMYGIGPGLKALNSVVLANLYTNCSKLAAMGSFFPATLSSLDIKLIQNNRTTGNKMSDQYSEAMSAMPGSKSIICANPGVEKSGAPPVTIISKPPEQMAVFQEAATKCLDSISSTYLVTLLDRLATIGQKRDVTAEEVIKQDNRDSQRFKATIEPFYCSILHPLVKAVASGVISDLYKYYGNEIAQIREKDNQFLLMHNCNIDLFNYEQKQNSSERMKAALEYSEVMKGLGRPIPEKVLELIDKLALDMLK